MSAVKELIPNITVDENYMRLFKKWWGMLLKFPELLSDGPRFPHRNPDILAAVQVPPSVM